MKNIFLYDPSDYKLTELSKKRKESSDPVRTKTAILAQLIDEAHKKEITEGRKS